VSKFPPHQLRTPIRSPVPIQGTEVRTILLPIPATMVVRLTVIPPAMEEAVILRSMAMEPADIITGIVPTPLRLASAITDRTPMDFTATLVQPDIPHTATTIFIPDHFVIPGIRILPATDHLIPGADISIRMLPIGAAITRCWVVIFPSEAATMPLPGHTTPATTEVFTRLTAASGLIVQRCMAALSFNPATM